MNGAENMIRIVTRSGGTAGARLAERALVFGLVIYALFCLRAWLSPGVLPPLLSPKRLLTAALGAVLFWATLTRFEMEPRLTRRFRFHLIAHSFAAALLIFVFRRYAGALTGEVVTLAEDGRWALVWIGFFAAAVALHMARPPARRPASAAAPPLALADPPERSADEVLSRDNIEAWAWVLDALAEEIAKAPDGAQDKLLNELSRRAGARSEPIEVGGIAVQVARQSLIDQLRQRTREGGRRELAD